MKLKETMTRNEMINEIFSHQSNLIYNNETDSYNKVHYSKKNLLKLTNAELIEIFEDMTTNYNLYTIEGE